MSKPLNYQTPTKMEALYYKITNDDTMIKKLEKKRDITNNPKLKKSIQKKIDIIKGNKTVTK